MNQEIEKIKKLEKRREVASYQRKITTQIGTVWEYDKELSEIDKKLGDLYGEVITFIKDHTGVDLKRCPHFEGVNRHNGKYFFNVVLSERLSESNDYAVLKRFSRKYNFFSVEPNGLKRLAIFINLESEKKVEPKLFKVWESKVDNRQELFIVQLRKVISRYWPDGKVILEFVHDSEDFKRGFLTLKISTK